MEQAEDDEVASPHQTLAFEELHMSPKLAPLPELKFSESCCIPQCKEREAGVVGGLRSDEWPDLIRLL